jgi:hypothetical protein
MLAIDAQDANLRGAPDRAEKTMEPIAVVPGVHGVAWHRVARACAPRHAHAAPDLIDPSSYSREAINLIYMSGIEHS